MRNTTKGTGGVSARCYAATTIVVLSFLLRLHESQIVTTAFPMIPPIHHHHPRRRIPGSTAPQQQERPQLQLQQQQQQQNQQQQQEQWTKRATFFSLYSSVGGGSSNNNNKGNGNEKGGMDDFLDPNYQESEQLQRAREYMSENSLPINFDMNDDDDDDDTEKEQPDEPNQDAHDELARSLAAGLSPSSSPSPPSSSSALVPNSAGIGADNDDARTGNLMFLGDNNNDTANSTLVSTTTTTTANNPYIATVTRLSPSELISKFTATAHPRVQNAVRQTILGLIGGLPKLAFDTTTITTGQRLASLMFQLQMTGYMFKNADYRLSLQQSLNAGGSDGSDIARDIQNRFILKGTAYDDKDDNESTSNKKPKKNIPLDGAIKGKVRIRYGNGSSNDDDDDTNNNTASSSSSSSSNSALEMEVDAAAYMSELRSEVAQLRDDLLTARQAKEDLLRKDLLLYIRTLPEQELRSLTNTMSPEVLVAMKALVNAVLSGIGDGQIGPDTVTEQSGEAMAQLCMWQLAIGYNLRTLEVREEMKVSFLKASSGSKQQQQQQTENHRSIMTGDSGIDYSGEPGILE